MGQVNIYTEKRDLELERMQRHYALTPEQRFYDLIKLCRLSMKMAGRTTMGEPQGKGLVIRKLKRAEGDKPVEGVELASRRLGSLRG
jgi:hypothetical protein